MYFLNYICVCSVSQGIFLKLCFWSQRYGLEYLLLLGMEDGLSGLTANTLIHSVIRHPKCTNLKYEFHTISSPDARYGIFQLFCSFPGSLFNEHTDLELGDFLLLIVLVKLCLDHTIRKMSISIC